MRAYYGVQNDHTHILPSAQKLLQAKINKIPRILDFSLLNDESENERTSLDFNLLRKRGLRLWLVRAQHDHYESKCERKSGGIYLPFHYESECENKSRDFYL